MKVQAIKNYFPSYKFLKIFQIIKILMYETNNISEYKKKMSNDEKKSAKATFLSLWKSKLPLSFLHLFTAFFKQQ